MRAGAVVLGSLLLVVGVPRAARWVVEAREVRPPRFLTGEQCMACHNQIFSGQGEDLSIGVAWRASIMANSSRDPYWQAAVRREIMDHPRAAEEIENECSRCHMPMSNVEERVRGRLASVFAHLPVTEAETELDRLAIDGVSCTLCHQITEERLGTEESFSGGFVVDTLAMHGRIFGPFEVDGGRARIMRSATTFEPTAAPHIQTSEHCATCHVLYTHTLGPNDEVIGRLPEQTPYQEWLASDFAGVRSCQDCHMAATSDSAAITSVLGQPRPGVSRHWFVGGNFFMLRMLNRYRDALGVEALPAELEQAALLTEDFLRTETAVLTIERTAVAEGTLEIDLVVENLTGHKFPTAYPSRRAWLHVIVRDRRGGIIFESGAPRPDGSIVGNDNDDDPRRFERHHQVITSPEQVQVYESIMVTPEGVVTTGLLTGIRYVKDNRLLPRGFDKGGVPEDIAVQGWAARDDDFRAGRDRVRYRVSVEGVEGPFEVDALLWYQPISFRWANNLRAYDAFETNRFVTYFDSMADASAIVVARSVATIR